MRNMSFSIDPNMAITNCLEKGLGIKQYEAIITEIKSETFTATPTFRKMYNSFFVVGRKTAEWYDYYYSLLEEQKEHKRSFEELLNLFKEFDNSIQVSFSSKLIAAVDPTKPIWDQYVLKNLGLLDEWKSYDNKTQKERIEKATKIYEALCGWYASFLESEEGKKCIEVFDNALPGHKELITKTKKIDFILWCIR